jgi:pimeloyl-ACP methyl ester carboxylesterase
MVAKIREISQGDTSSNTTIIVINGFLSEGSEDINDWLDTIPERNKKHRICHLEWEASNLSKNVYKYILGRVASIALISMIPIVGWAYGTSTAINIAVVVSSWKKSIKKTIEAGDELARYIDKEDRDYIILGHSLGARVSYHGLSKVKKIDRVKNVGLLGGAVSVQEDWKGILKKNNSINIYNLFSKNDAVLKYLYKAGTGFSDKPIGTLPIGDKRIKNCDVSKIVNGHMEYKKDKISHYLSSQSFWG